MSSYSWMLIFFTAVMECDFLASWRVASSAASGEFDSEWRVKHPDMQIMTNN